MACAPFDILGVYNGLDSAGTYQLYEYLHTFAAQFPVWWDYHQNDYMNEVVLLIEQTLDGLPVDLEQVSGHGEKLDIAIGTKLSEFLAHPDVSPHVASYNEDVVQQLISEEPPKLKKDGGVTVRWEKWQAKVNTARCICHFNTDSPAQLSWLFYEKMKLPVKRRTDKDEPSVDVKAISGMGVVGRMLLEYRKLRDERKFITTVNNVHVNGIIHPRLISPGTITGRISAGELE
jgi:hypothetical protein